MNREKIEEILKSAFVENTKDYMTGLIDGFRYVELIQESEWAELMKEYVWSPSDELLALLEK